MNEAPCSERTKINRIEESRRASIMWMFSSPGTPKMYSTPSCSRHSTSNCATLSSEVVATTLPFVLSALSPSAGMITVFGVEGQAPASRRTTESTCGGGSCRRVLGLLGSFFLTDRRFVARVDRSCSTNLGHVDNDACLLVPDHRAPLHPPAP